MNTSFSADLVSSNDQEVFPLYIEPIDLINNEEIFEATILVDNTSNIVSEVAHLDELESQDHENNKDLSYNDATGT